MINVRNVTGRHRVPIDQGDPELLRSLDRLDQDVSHRPVEADFVTQHGTNRRLSLSISDLRHDTVSVDSF